MTQPDARESAVAATVAPLPAVDLMGDGIAPQQPGFFSTRRWAFWTVPALAVALAAGGAILLASPGSEAPAGAGSGPAQTSAGVSPQGAVGGHVSGVQHRHTPVRRIGPHA
jgi:hypothetical protein